MTMRILEKTASAMIGKTPVVVLPLKEWGKVEAILEEYEMSVSKGYHASVQAAREEARRGKLHEFILTTRKFKKAKT